MNPFGRAWRDKFYLDPAVVYLNHGTVGVTPIEVLEAQQQIVRAIERHPSRYLLRELTEVGAGRADGGPPHLRVAAERVAAFLGVDGRDLVFVDNASTGVNAVLRSFPLQRGDTIALTRYGYGSVQLAAQAVAERVGATVAVIGMPFPVRSPAEVVAAFDAGLPPGTRLAIVDHIASDTGLLLPIAEIAAICRARGVVLLVDGAHAPGSIDLDIDALGADLYTANLHKWMWTPRSSGILWAKREHQAWLQPVVTSWGASFPASFDLPGTRDPSAHLAAPAALDLLERVGVAAVRDHNHALVWAGARRLAERWGTELVTPESMVASMVAVPLPARLGTTREAALALRFWLQDTHNVELHVGADGERMWARVAGQVYVTPDDFERAGDAVLAR
ncbi:MAG: aminotransferase class V-fold PLP-dependent enzyme [Myxococcota bacterium]